MTVITDDVPTTEPNPWAAYFESITADVPQVAIAARVGVSQSTISHWTTGRRRPTFYQARDLARAYGANPIGALIAAGLLTEDDIRVPSGDPRRLSTHALMTELSRRVNEGDA